MNKSGPIGFFDSGVGGTSIWKEAVQLLPNEDTIYLADSRNAPYGEKPAEEIVALSIKNCEKLLSMGCKIIVVACNTATTNAISRLREKYYIPIIGIEPAIKPAALKSKTKFIGILATKGTLSSALFSKTSELYTQNITVIEVIGEGLVAIVEQGAHESPETETWLRNLLKPMLMADIDYLVLGCSHFPYLMPVLKKIFPSKVSIIDSGEAVARQTKNVLERKGLINQINSKGHHRLFSNSDPEVLAALVDSENEGYEVSYLDF